MSITRSTASRGALLEGYRRVGRRVALLALLLAGGSVALGAIVPLDDIVTPLFGSVRIAPVTALSLAIQAVGLWLIGHGRERAGAHLSGVVAVVALVALGVGVGCDIGWRPTWCQDAGGWPALLPSSQVNRGGSRRGHDGCEGGHDAYTEEVPRRVA